MFLRGCEQLLMVFEKLDCWLCYEDMDATLYGVERNRVVGSVRGKDSD
jgi:hypothetical protein